MGIQSHTCEMKLMEMIMRKKAKRDKHYKYRKST